jgi:hypothetical protein
VNARLALVEQGWPKAKNEGRCTPVRTCPRCGKDIPEEEIAGCPYCGASLSIAAAPLLPFRKPAQQIAKRSSLLLLVGVLVIVVVSGLVTLMLIHHEATTPSLMSGSLAESQPPDAQLSLLSVQCQKPHRVGPLIFEGEVRNVSDAFWRDVVAVVTVYDESPTRIGSGEAPIARISLPPGESSPFTVAVTYDPLIMYYKVTFKDRSGNVIPTQSKR